MTVTAAAAPAGGRSTWRPGVAAWPAEREAAVRLARARHLHARIDPADARWRAIADRQLDVAEARARDLLDRPGRRGGGPDEMAASARGRAALAAMLDPDPATRAAATDDITRAWPAEHLRVLQHYAEHERGHRRVPAMGDDAVERARAAVAALPAAQQSDRTDGVLISRNAADWSDEDVPDVAERVRS